VAAEITGDTSSAVLSQEAEYKVEVSMERLTAKVLIPSKDALNPKI
jgi:hypothetical protein